MEYLQTNCSSTANFIFKGTWSVHSFNGDYLAIPEGTGSCWYLFHEIPGTSRQKNDIKTNLTAFLWPYSHVIWPKKQKSDLVFFLGMAIKRR